jgi:hypothetical protein
LVFDDAAYIAQATKMTFARRCLSAITQPQEQMERHMTQRVVILVLALLGMTRVALAHPDQPNALFHLLTEPDHLAMLSLVVIAGVFAVRKIRSTR